MKIKITLAVVVVGLISAILYLVIPFSSNHDKQAIQLKRGLSSPFEKTRIKAAKTECDNRNSLLSEDELRQGLGDESIQVRWYCALALLINFEGDPEAISTAKEVLASEDFELISGYYDILNSGVLSNQTNLDIFEEPIFSMAKSSKIYIQAFACWTIKNVPLYKSKLVPTLISMFEEGQAAEAISIVGFIRLPMIEGALGSVIAEFCDEQSELQYEACQVLLDHDSALLGFLDELTSQLESDDPNQRVRAARILENMAIEAREEILKYCQPATQVVISRLHNACIEREQTVYPIALLLLNLLEPDNPGTIKAQVQWLTSSSSMGALEVNMMLSLGTVSQNFELAMPALVVGLEREKLQLQNSTLRAIKEIGSSAAPITPKLVDLLNDPDFDQNERVADVLIEIGPGGIEAAPALLKQIKDENRSWRSIHLFARALLAIEADPGEVLAVLRNRGTSDLGLRNQSKVQETCRLFEPEPTLSE